MTHGVLLINKSIDITSFQAVKKTRGVLKIKKVGHSGTLDPLASGLLCVGIGQGTKTFPFFKDFPKTYVAHGKLGYQSDSYDAKGEITEVSSRKVDIREFKDLMNTFQGEITQKPPAFSALKIQGKPAYYYARKGIPVEIKTRKVNVYSIKLLNFDYPDFSLEIKCSSGTYVRSIIHDLGALLKTGAYMDGLIRVSIGDFHIADSVSLEGHINKEDLEKRIIPLNKSLEFLPELKLSDPENFALENGLELKKNSIVDNRVIGSEHYRIEKKIDDKTILAIVKRKKNSYNEEWKWSYCRIFTY